MGLDLGRQRAMGLCAVALWALGLAAPALVLGAGRKSRAADLGTRTGRLGRRTQLECRFLGRFGARGGLVPAGAARSVPTELPRVANLREADQYRACHQHQQHHQHHEPGKAYRLSE